MNLKQPGIYLSAAIVCLSLVIVTLTFKEKATLPLSITLAEARQPAFALIYIAEENGYFDEELLTVNYRYFSSGRDALQDVLKGNSDIATVFEAPVVFMASKGEDLRVLSTLHKSSNNTGLIALRSRGIETVSDFRGKRIGVPKQTNAELFLYFFLQSQGLNLSEVIIIDVLPEALESSLANGLVDGVSVWNPYLYAIKDRFTGDTVQFNSSLFSEMSMLVTSKYLNNSKRESFLRLYKALSKAEKYLKSSDNRALQLVINRLDELPEKYVRANWNKFKPILSLDPILLSVLEDEAKWLYKHGFIDNDQIKFEKIIHPEYLQIVNPNSITMKNSNI